MLATAPASWPDYLLACAVVLVGAGTVSWRLAIYLRVKRHARVVGDLIEKQPRGQP